MGRMISLVLAVTAVMILAAGCSFGSYSVVMASENNTQTSMQMSYEKFSGNKNRVISIKEGEACEVTVDIASESGKLDLSIEDEDGNSYYRGTELPTSSFTVYLDKAGKYIIRVEGDVHTGSYNISWDIK